MKGLLKPFGSKRLLESLSIIAQTKELWNEFKKRYCDQKT